ncbi:MarR family winged helix-turn-helix transcriptional regulator [Lutimaribacter marinistellae]|uniref:MarR family winged helix-turn-helix transcriptional regulator n=2 Tax=Lutimaribacter marinistellae TaxID=1820329 RepID=A0ABV7TIV1_9RHOB
MTNAGEEDMSSGDFVNDYLLYLLAAASEAASAQFHAHVREQGVRVPEWRILACLHDQDGQMVTRLAGYALIEQSRLTKIIAQMEDRGLVTRRGDSKDRRRVRVFLTPAGRELADRLVADARHHEADLLQRLRGSDGARIKPALRAILQNLSQADPAEQQKMPATVATDPS